MALNINKQDINGNTPIIKAAIVGNRDLVSFFLDLGADPNIKNNISKIFLEPIPTL